jgi:uncharacterized phage protein gp47/JayE
MTYVVYPRPVTGEDLARVAVDRIRADYPSWDPQPGGFDWLLIESLGQIVAEMVQASTDVRTSLFRHAGLHIFGVAPIDAAPASGVTTWTASDTVGYVIPAGTLVGYRHAGDVVVFATVADTILPSGVSTVSGVVVTATTPGADGNGLTGPELIDSTLPWVTAVTQATPTTGGEDGETDDAYLARLPDEIRVQNTPVLPGDFQAVALRVPGVGRAVAIEGWDTTANTIGNERMVGVAVTDPAGQPVAPAVRSQVEATLEAMREANFVASVAAPTYTNVTVTYAATCYPGWTPSEVETRVDSAILAFLDPAQWGIPRTAEGADASRVWVNEPVVRVNDLIALIDQVDGVRTVTTVQVNGAGDLTLSGRVGLPSPQPPVGTITPTT